MKINMSAQSIHTKEGVEEIKRRVQSLTKDSQPQWGKMNVAQMLAHLKFPLQVPMGQHQLPKSFLMKVIGPMIRKKLLSDAPISKNSPTASTIKVTDTRDFEKEKAGLIKTLEEYSAFARAGKLPAAHPYWGKLSKADWDKMQWKHLDHHLGQFGV